MSSTMIHATPADDERLAQPSTLLAMVIVTVSCVGWNALFERGTGTVALFVPGAVYLALCTVGWWWCEARGRAAMAAMLVALTAVSFVMLWMTDLRVMLLVMPVICLIVLHAGLRWAIGVIALLCGFAALIAARDGAAPLEIYSRSTGFLPGAAFAVVFSQVLLRERRARQQARRYATQVEELAVTGERNRIAREIHDSVGHYLTVVHVQIEAARAIASADPARADECLVRAQELSREGLSELRRSVAMLRVSSTTERPFAIALAGLVEECERGGLDASLTIHGAPRALAPAVEFTLYRVAQEALTNVKRHACAAHARCTLGYDEHEVRLRIEDDGVGAVRVEDGFGLLGLRERVQSAGGTVALDTAAGRGFAIEVRVPT
jgi:signal transduction histidine kinase